MAKKTTDRMKTFARVAGTISIGFGILAAIPSAILLNNSTDEFKSHSKGSISSRIDACMNENAGKWPPMKSVYYLSTIDKEKYPELYACVRDKHYAAYKRHVDYSFNAGMNVGVVSGGAIIAGFGLGRLGRRRKPEVTPI